MDRITVLIPNPEGQPPGVSLIAVSYSRDTRAAIYLARPTPSYQGTRWDPVPMPAELRYALTAAGLFVPAA